jgi:hypothetical protein
MYIIGIYNNNKLSYLRKDKKVVDSLDEMCYYETYSEANNRASKILSKKMVFSTKDILSTEDGKKLIQQFCLTALSDGVSSAITEENTDKQ